MGLKVYNECCKNCLLSKDRIVSAKIAKDIIKGCTEKQTHFICHKATIENKEIVCKSFYDKFGHVSQMVRIAERMNMVEFINQSESEKLTPHSNIGGGKRFSESADAEITFTKTLIRQ